MGINNRITLKTENCKKNHYIQFFIDYDYEERRTQLEIEKVFNISSSTIRKWYMHIVEELHIEITI